MFTRLGECLVNCCGAEVGLRSPQLCMLLGFLEQLGGLAEGSAGAEAVLQLCERQVAVRSDAGAGVAVAVVCAAGASAPAGAMRARHVLQAFLGYHAAPVVAAVVRRDAAERSAQMNEYTANNAIGLGPAAAEDCLGGETHFHRFEAAILRPLLREPACEEAWLRPVLDASGRTLCCYVVEAGRHVRLRLLRGRETDRERDKVDDSAESGVVGAVIDGHLEGYGSLWSAVLACCGSCGGGPPGSAPPVRNGAGGNGVDSGTEVMAMAAAATKTHLCGTGVDEVCVVAACVSLTEPNLCVVAICKGGDRTTATAEHAAVATACEAAARVVRCAFEPSASASERAPANALSVHNSGEAAVVDRGHAAAVAAATLPQQCMGAADHPGVLPGAPIVVELADTEEAAGASGRASSRASGHANFNANGDADGTADGTAATDVPRQMATFHQSVNLKDAEARGAHSAVAAVQSPNPASSSASVSASASASPAASPAASAIISPPSCPSTPSTPSAPASLETTTNRTGSPDPSTPGPSSGYLVLEKRGNETHGSPSMNDSSHHDASAVTMQGHLSPAVLSSMPPPMGHAAKLVSLQSRVPTTPTGDRPPKAFTRRHHHGAATGGGKANGTRDAGEAEEQGGSGSGNGGAIGAKSLPPGGLYSPMPKGT